MCKNVIDELAAECGGIDALSIDTQGETIIFTDENGKAKIYPQFNIQDSHSIVRNLDENGNYDGTMTMTIYDRGTEVRGAAVPAKLIFDKYINNAILYLNKTLKNNFFKIKGDLL